MTKIVRGKARDGTLWNILVPDVHSLSFIKNSKLSYLDIFFAFAQHVPFEKTEAKEEGLRRTMLELQNKIVQLEHFAKLEQLQEKRLLTMKRSKRISSYRPFQIFLGLNAAYLDSLHSLRDMVRDIDRLFGRRLSETIWSSGEFRLNMDLRNLLHHHQSPLISVTNSKLLITFSKKRILKLQKPQYLTAELMKEYHDDNVEFELTCDDFLQQILSPLNQWAFEYLKEVKPDVQTNVILGYRKNGSSKHKKVTLQEVLDKVSP